MNKILIVDDQRSIREGLIHALGNKGFDVRSASSGEEALLFLEKEPFDILISDLRMPGISGLELVEKTKKLNLDLKIILISAYFTTEDAVAAVKYGVSDLYPKPFDVNELIERIMNLSKEDNGKQISESKIKPIKSDNNFCCIYNNFDFYSSVDSFSFQIVQGTDFHDFILITSKTDEFDKGYLNRELKYLLIKNQCRSIQNDSDLKCFVKTNKGVVGLLTFSYEERKLNFLLSDDFCLYDLNNTTTVNSAKLSNDGILTVQDSSLIIFTSIDEKIPQNLLSEFDKHIDRSFAYQFFTEKIPHHKLSYSGLFIDVYLHSCKKIYLNYDLLLKNMFNMREVIDSLEISISLKTIIYALSGHVLSLAFDKRSNDNNTFIEFRNTSINSIDIKICGFTQKELSFNDIAQYEELNMLNTDFIKKNINIITDENNEIIFKVSA